MANSNRVTPNTGKSGADGQAIKKKRQRRPVSHTSSFGSLTVLRQRMHDFNLIRWIFIGLGVVMVIGVVGSVPNMGSDRDLAGTGVVARIDGYKVEREPFEREVEARKESPYYSLMGGGPGQELATRHQVLEDIIDRRLKLQAARREGNKVGRKQLQERIDQAIDAEVMQAKSQFKDPKDFQTKFLEKRMKVKDEAGLRKKIRSQISREWIAASREAILMENLQRKIEKQAAGLPIDKAKPEDIEIHVRQIVITTDKRSEAEAKKLAEAALAQVKAGADFAKVAKEKSDDTATKAQGGDRQWVGKSGFWEGPELEQAAFALQPGQVSDLIKTRNGYYILKVEGRRFSPRRHWDAYVAELKKKAKIEVQDPLLVAYRQYIAPAKDDAERKKNRAAAMKLFQEALPKVYLPDTLAAVQYTLGQMHREDKNLAKAAEAFGQAAQARPSPEIYMALADTQKELKKTEAALESYKLASDMASDTTSQQHYFVHMMLQGIFSEMKQPALAAKEKAWIDEFMKQQQSGMGGFPGGTFTIPPR